MRLIENTTSSVPAEELTSLTAEEIRSLTFAELVGRMDAIRTKAQRERYGAAEQLIPFPKVSEVFKISSISNLPEETKRRLADAAFRFLFQLDLLSVASGIGNIIIFNDKFSNETSWLSPSFRMRYAVINQYHIVASRIALECFFDLLHVAHKGKRIDSDKKFKAFKKWILEQDNPYQFFLGHILEAHEFDRKHRTPEVHGTSRFVHEIMCLQTPTADELNLANRLTNILINAWNPFLEILNGVKPLSMPIFSTCKEFALHYLKGRDDTEAFDEFLTSLTERLK